MCPPGSVSKYCEEPNCNDINSLFRVQFNWKFVSILCNRLNNLQV